LAINSVPRFAFHISSLALSLLLSPTSLYVSRSRLSLYISTITQPILSGTPDPLRVPGHTIQQTLENLEATPSFIISFLFTVMLKQLLQRMRGRSHSKYWHEKEQKRRTE
jgi:hypothetical protein